MDKIRGVNLGNWLVLEKWMSPELYSDTTAEDETYLCLQLSEGEKRSRLQVHRDHYITSRDFAYIAEKGFNAVRLPVPFFVFEDYGPYVHCVEYVDKAMKWAGDYHLKVLLDLHTVPGSQNGSDNAGICGIVQWAQYPERVEIALDVLERLALRYGQTPALLGIEVLNEPQPVDGHLSKLMESIGINIMERYQPVDREAARKNKGYTKAWLEQFYLDAYARIRKYLPVDKAVVFDDAFDIHHFADWVAAQNFENVILDTHQYIMLADWMHLCEPNYKEYVRYVRDVFTEEVSYGQAKVPTICGEWCLFNAQPGLGEESPAVRKEVYTAIAKAQMEAFDHCSGWFYWCYKTHLDDPDWDCWDIGKCISNGWMPDRYS